MTDQVKPTSRYPWGEKLPNPRHDCAWVKSTRVLWAELKEIKKALDLKSTEVLDVEKLKLCKTLYQTRVGTDG